MAVGRQLNVKGQMRLDVPHVRLLESGVVYDFDTLAGSMMTGRNPFVVTGFSIASWVAGTPAAGITIQVANSVIFNWGASENGTMLFVPANRVPEVLTVTNARVIGGFTASQTNYIGVDFIRLEDTSTDDIVAFLDATTDASTPKTIPLGRTLDYRIIISTSPFSTNSFLCPIAKVVTDASNNIVTVTDARTMFFRLALGGDSPNPLGIYSWPQGRAPEVTTSFTGGDKAITNEKDWKSAIMQRIWEVTGGEQWYSDTTDRNIKFYADPGDTHARAGTTDNQIWDGTDLTWSGLHIILMNSTSTINNIPDQTVTSPGLTNLADGDVIYCEINRYVNSFNVTMVKVTTAAYNALAAPTRVGSRFVVFWRKGTQVYGRFGFLAVGLAIGVATTGGYGIVKINSTNVPVGGPFAVVSDASDGNAIATGLTRSNIGAGLLSVGTGTNDTSITIGSIANTTALTLNSQLSTAHGPATSQKFGFGAYGGAAAQTHGLGGEGASDGVGVVGTAGSDFAGITGFTIFGGNGVVGLGNGITLSNIGPSLLNAGVVGWAFDAYGVAAVAQPNSNKEALLCYTDGSTAPLRLIPVTATPAVINDGDVWINSTDHKLYWRESGTTHSVGP